MFEQSERTAAVQLAKIVRRLCLVTGVVAMTMASRGSTFTNFLTLWPFAGTNGIVQPDAALTEGSDGMLYGTTYGDTSGTNSGVFRIDKDGSDFQVLRVFAQSEGYEPMAPVIEATNGVLYGTTSSDTTNGAGTIFKMNKDGSGFAVLHYFTFATTNDGGNPAAGLLQASDGELYGTAQFGGAAPEGNGIVFRIDLSGSNFTVLHSFNGSDGDSPAAALIEGTNGALYGTAYDGGVTNGNGGSGDGTVFQIDKTGSNFAVVHYFAGGPSDGYSPFAKLFKGPNGKLYGTTISGGTDIVLHSGVAFSLDYNGSNYMVLHNFGTNSEDGNSPQSDLVQGPDGALYGTTYYRGASTDSGTVFVMNADGSSYAIVTTFLGTNGSNPNPLIVGSDGALYDTCNFSGPLGQGTVFKLTGILPDVLASPINLGNGWRVSGHGSANLNYTLLYTTNISTPSSNWTSLGTVSADSSGNWHYDDLTNTPLRFYETSFP